MKLKYLLCAAIAAAGFTAPAVAENDVCAPEDALGNKLPINNDFTFDADGKADTSKRPQLVPHRGIWKVYKENGHFVPENSVISYNNANETKLAATGKTPDYIEIDIRVANVKDKHNSIEWVPVVFHDEYWDRLTNNFNAGDSDTWAVKVFNGHGVSDVHRLFYRADFPDKPETPITQQHLGSTKLRRVQKQGGSELSSQSLLRLSDYIEQTACKGDTKLLLDLQDPVVMSVAADEFYKTDKDGKRTEQKTCPKGTKHHGKKYSEVAYMRPFATSVVHDDGLGARPADLAKVMVSHYGNDLNYVWGINSGQFDDANCTKSSQTPCKMRDRSRNTYNVLEFIDGVLKLPQTKGLNFSYPGAYKAELTDVTKMKQCTIRRLYKAYKDNPQNIPLFSAVTRPEGAFHFNAKDRMGSILTDTPKPVCLPFAYASDTGEVFLYNPGKFNDRNRHAIQDGYDYVIADGYRDPLGKLDFDPAKEIGKLCGSHRWVIMGFDIEPNSNQVWTYKHLRKPKGSSYYRINATKGYPHDIEDVYGMMTTSSDAMKMVKSLDPIGVPHVDPRDTDYGVPDPTPSDPADTRDDLTPGTVSADCMLEATLTPSRLSQACVQEFLAAGIARPTPTTQNPLCGPATGQRDLEEDIKNGCFDDNRLGDPFQGPSLPIAPTLPGFPG